MGARKFSTLALIYFAIACADEKVQSRFYPVVDTNEVSDIGEQGATFNGEILNLGDGARDHGFLFNKGPIQGSNTDEADRLSLGPVENTGKFSALANRNLAVGAMYYVRAYAIAKTSGMAVYGQQVSFISKGSEPPRISDINVKAAAIGDSIILIGEGFSDLPANNHVTIGGQIATPFRSQPDSLWTTIPAMTPAGENIVALEVGQQKVQAAVKFTLLPITMSSFEPVNVTFGDTVILHGSNFPTSSRYMLARILGKEISIQPSTRSVLHLIVPSEPAVTNSFIQISAGAQTVQSTTELKLLPPVIKSFSPSKGIKDTDVVLIGDNFHPTAAKNKVALASKNVVVVEASRTSMKVKIPAGINPGTYNFSVTAGNQTVTSLDAFQIVQPVIFQVSPLNGTWGTTVSITGDNFGSGMTDNLVTFGDQQATIVSTSTTEIKVIVPASLLQISSTVKVVSVIGENRSATFATEFQLDAPEITSFSPSEGKGQSIVTIVGKNFNPVPANQVVKFGDQVAEVVNATSTELSVKVPTSIAESSIFLEITAAAQTVASAAQFHLISPWKRITTLPASARRDATAFTLNGSLYIGFGASSEKSVIKTFWRYNPPTDQWTQTATFATSFGTTDPYTNICGFSIGAFGFVGAGSFGSFDRGTVRKYDPSIDKWLTAQTLSDKVNNAVGFAVGDKGYVATGINLSNQLSARIWEYSANADTWTQKASLPGPARFEAGVFTLNDRAYIIGGFSCYNCSSMLKDVWEYDPATDRWTEKASLPVARRGAMGFAIDGKGYIIGGRSTNEANFAEVFTYNPEQNQWQKLPDFPAGTLLGGVAVTVGNKAYIGTGILNGELTSEIWEFDPSKM